MLILLLFPNDHLVWAARMPPVPVSGLLERIRSGAWTFPLAWRRRLEQDFDLPDPLPLRVRACGSLLIVVPRVPLKEKTVLVKAGSLRDLRDRLAKHRKKRPPPRRPGFQPGDRD